MHDLRNVEFRWGVKVPLRDGTNLNATVYLATDRAGPGPCIVTLTPYVCDLYHERGVYFASHGLSFVTVDVRGRGNSDGVFQPFFQEAHDGYDVVEWLARQPFCNGRVAMWGGSYGGYVQWATAKELPPHLATIVPVAAPCAGVDLSMRNNIFYPYILQWITFVSGRSSQAHIFADRAFWSAIYRRWYESGRPFREIDTVLGNPSPLLQEWLNHPEPDAYWDSLNPSAEQYARLDFPILTITGCYDGDQPGALAHYAEHLRNAASAARERHCLVIGPWDHAGTRTPRAEVGGVRFGPASLLDIPKLHIEWYAWTLQDCARPEFLKKRVAYYVMGAECWRYADSLDEITERHDTYFLDSACNADDVFSSGFLASAPGTGLPDGYTYDPCDPVGPELVDEVAAVAQDNSLVDQRLVHALRGKQLVYHSEPFATDIEISGFFKLTAWIAIDCPDTDLYVSVHEVDRDGSSILLSSDAMRARYREGLRTPQLIRTEESLRYHFDRFTFVSRQVKRGHRLRLVVAPIGHLVGTTFAEKNYNSGGIVAEESSRVARPVTVRLFHDREHASALQVPVARCAP